jgi:hypothetical protein
VGGISQIEMTADCQLQNAFVDELEWTPGVDVAISVRHSIKEPAR